MKAYGYKKKKNMVGDGCFLCDPSRKVSKKAVRTKAKNQARKEAREIPKKDE
jgi:hypothetical protein